MNRSRKCEAQEFFFWGGGVGEGGWETSVIDANTVNKGWHVNYASEDWIF